MAYTPHTENETKQMLAAIGVRSIEDLFSHLPEAIRLRKDLAFPVGMGEMDLEETFERMIRKNRPISQWNSFLGGGSYDHFVPSAVDALAGRSEFVTAYTPYQPETSQGMLQAIFEYQTMIAELTGLPYANASMYDGASALAEAVLMALAGKSGTRALVAAGVSPLWRQVIVTYLEPRGVTIELLPEKEGRVDLRTLESMSGAPSGAFCLVVSNPNFYGAIEEMPALGELSKKLGLPLIAAVDPLSLAILEPPGACGAEIVVGDGQVLGNYPSLGGPSFGFMAASEKFLRRLPGRISGQTSDAEGRRGFVLTLQTREQHIRREKATSNICSNQALCALRGLIYLSLLGRNGIDALGRLLYGRIHALAGRLEKLPGYFLPCPRPYFRELVVRCPKPADEVVAVLRAKGVIPGVPLGRFYPDRSRDLLIAVTEKKSSREIDALVEGLSSIG